jgi:hypothetical protein
MTTSTVSPALDFVVYTVADMPQSLDFFKKLGFEYVPGESDQNFSYLKGATGSPDFGLRLAGENTPPAGTTQVYFKTDSLESLREEVTGKGIEASTILQMPFGDIFHVNSPDNQNIVMMRG